MGLDPSAPLAARSALKSRRMARYFPILRTIRLSLTERSRPFPTNLPKVRDLPSKFTDSLNPLKQNVSAYFSLCFSLPSPACPQRARRAAVRGFFLLFDIFPFALQRPSQALFRVPAVQSIFPPWNCNRRSLRPPRLQAPRKRVSPVCSIFPYSWTSRPHRGSQVPLRAFPALPCPAIVSFWNGFLLSPSHM